MEMVARTYLIYDITGSPAKLGIMSLAQAVPMVALSVFGGAIADRVSKKGLILICQAAMSMVSLGNAIAVAIDYLGPAHPESWWVLLAGAIIMGIITAMVMPSRQAIIPELVGLNQIMNAISLNTMGMSLFQLIGPITAGYVIKSFGYAAVFFVMTTLNIIAFVFTAFIPKTAASKTPHQNVLNNISEGFEYIINHRTIFLLLGLFVITIILAMPYQMLMPIFAKDILKVGVSGQGTLMSFAGFGAIACSLTLASIPSKRRGATFLFSIMLMGLALIAFAFSTSLPLSLSMMVLVGIGMTGNNTASAALIQVYTEPKFLGRVMSIMSVSFGLSSLGTFFASMLAESISPQWALGGLAIILAIISTGVFLFIPRIRKLD